eukprot:1877834-Prymnesium_polylepis.1
MLQQQGDDLDVAADHLGAPAEQSPDRPSERLRRVHGTEVVLAVAHSGRPEGRRGTALEPAGMEVSPGFQRPSPAGARGACGVVDGGHRSGRLQWDRSEDTHERQNTLHALERHQGAPQCRPLSGISRSSNAYSQLGDARRAGKDVAGAVWRPLVARRRLRARHALLRADDSLNLRDSQIRETCCHQDDILDDTFVVRCATAQMLDDRFVEG